MTPLLEFDQASFSYGNRTILSDIQCGYFDGECITLVGPNGVGKTTLLRLAAGILVPRTGDVRLHGQVLQSLKQRTIARSIALVPQNVEVPFAFTVEQFIEQGRTPFLRMFGGLRPADREAIEEAMDLTDTRSLRSRRYSTSLSGGERQRVKIALGLAQRPQASSARRTDTAPRHRAPVRNGRSDPLLEPSRYRDPRLHARSDADRRNIFFGMVVESGGTHPQGDTGGDAATRATGACFQLSTTPSSRAGRTNSGEEVASSMISTFPSSLAEVAAAIAPCEATFKTEAQRRLDNLTKPIGSLGHLESIAAQMYSIFSGKIPRSMRRAVYVFAADHGVTEEGVSAYPREVTAQMVRNFLNGGAAINVLARLHEAELTVVDVGVDAEFEDAPGLCSHESTSRQPKHASRSGDDGGRSFRRA